MKLEKLKKPGQIKEKDLLLIVFNGSICVERAKEILNSGTDREEIILVKKTNKYFITSMAIDGSSWAKDVRILREN